MHGAVLSCADSLLQIVSGVMSDRNILDVSRHFDRTSMQSDL